MVDYAPRPSSISGCWQTWTDQDTPQLIRSSMDSQFVKVRRRTTGLQRTASVTATYPRSVYQDFVDWFRVYCQTGVMPTVIVEPSGVESVWRFVEPPVIEWLDANAFRVSCTFEKMPGWQNVG